MRLPSVGGSAFQLLYVSRSYLERDVFEPYGRFFAATPLFILDFAGCKRKKRSTADTTIVCAQTDAFAGSERSADPLCVLYIAAFLPGGSEGVLREAPKHPPEEQDAGISVSRAVKNAMRQTWDFLTPFWNTPGKRQHTAMPLCIKSRDSSCRSHHKRNITGRPRRCSVACSRADP